MANNATPNMGLISPTILVTNAPQWAGLLNTIFNVVDAHDHSDGKGVQITPAGININTAVQFNDNKAEGLLSTQFVPQSSSLAGPLNTYSVYTVGFDLWYTNGQGVAIQLTRGGTPVGGTGGGGGSGSAGWTYTSIASYPYTVTSANAGAMLGVDSSTSRTVNLPAATTIVSFQIKDITGLANTNPISVVPNGTDNIEGLNTTKYLQSNWGAWTFTSDAVNNWWLS